MKELSLSMLICAWPVFMRANTLFMCTFLCSSIDMDTYPNMHVKTLHTHMRIPHVQVGTQKPHFSIILTFSPIYLSNCDSHVLFSSFCRSCPLSWVGAVPIASLLSIRPWRTTQRPSTCSWLQTYPSLTFEKFRRQHPSANTGWEVVGHKSHLSHCWLGDDSDSPQLPPNDRPSEWWAPHWSEGRVKYPAKHRPTRALVLEQEHLLFQSRGGLQTLFSGNT